MNLDKKLDDWVERQLLTREQASAILSYEKSVSPSNIFTYTFLTLGVSIVSLGILAFIAANWEDIPGSIKLLVDFMILSGLAVAIVYLHKQQKNLIRDRVIVLFQLLVLASIGLISQIFHTSGKLYEALGLWVAITLPLVLHAENKFPSHILLFSVSIIISEYLRESSSPHMNLKFFIFHLFTPSLFLVTGLALSNFRIPSIKRFGISSIFWGVITVILGTISFHFIYKFELIPELSYTPNSYIFSIIFYIIGSFIVSFYLFKLKKISAILSILISGFYIGIYLLRYNSDSSEFWDAFYFIFIWLFLGLLFLSLRFNRLFEASIVVVGIRFLVVYFQIFESLLMTSLGLVLSGVFIVCSVLLYMKYKEKIYNSLEKYL